MGIPMKSLPERVQRQIQVNPKLSPQFLKRPPAHTPGQMNSLEQQYALHLDLLQHAGEIAAWKFEPDKFRLAYRCYYTPDFKVTFPDGRVEYHEVKGYWREDARIKIKVAAAAFTQFQFVGVQLVDHLWQFERFKP